MYKIITPEQKVDGLQTNHFAWFIISIFSLIMIYLLKNICVYIDIDGLEGMKLTFGTTAVEGKDSQEKAAKVNFELIFPPIKIQEKK
jgi:hypothetical protein